MTGPAGYRRRSSRRRTSDSARAAYSQGGRVWMREQGQKPRYRQALVPARESQAIPTCFDFSLRATIRDSQRRRLQKTAGSVSAITTPRSVDHQMRWPVTGLTSDSAPEIGGSRRGCRRRLERSGRLRRRPTKLDSGEHVRDARRLTGDAPFVEPCAHGDAGDDESSWPRSSKSAVDGANRNVIAVTAP